MVQSFDDSISIPDFDVSTTSDEDVFLPAVPTLPTPPWRLNRSGAFRRKDRIPIQNTAENNNYLPVLPEQADLEEPQHLPQAPDPAELSEAEHDDPPSPRPRRSNRRRTENPKVKGDSWTI